MGEIDFHKQPRGELMPARVRRQIMREIYRARAEVRARSQRFRLHWLAAATLGLLLLSALFFSRSTIWPG